MARIKGPHKVYRCSDALIDRGEVKLVPWEEVARKARALEDISRVCTRRPKSEE